MADDAAKHGHHAKRKRSSVGESDDDCECEHKAADGGGHDTQEDDFAEYVSGDEQDAGMAAADEAPVEAKAEPAAADSDVVMAGRAAATLRCPQCNTFKPTTAFADEMLHGKSGTSRACLVCAAMTPAERMTSRAAAVAEQKDEQQCSICRVIRPIAEFRKRFGSTIRVVATCNICSNVPSDDIKHKKCRTCKGVKLLGEFEAAPNCKYGVMGSCKVCRKEKHLTRMIVVTEKKCKECKATKPAATFSRSAKARDGLYSFCKPCAAKLRKACQRTKDGFLKLLYQSCKSAYGKTCTIPSSSTHDYAKLQHDACELSGIDFNYSGGSSWQPSIEAKDPSLGHVHGNCALIILELNTPSGWSPERIVEHLKLRHQTPVMTAAEVVKQIQTPGTVENRRAQELLRTSKRNSDKRNTKRHRADNQHEYTFTLEDICDMVLEEDNRCYWSGQPIDWSEDANHWAPSPDRLDVFKGYIKANLRLVCRAFNAPDFSSVIKHKEGAIGSHGWNREKYAEFHASVCRKYSSQLSDLDKQLDVYLAVLSSFIIPASRTSASSFTLPPSPSLPTLSASPTHLPSLTSPSFPSLTHRPTPAYIPALAFPAYLSNPASCTLPSSITRAPSLAPSYPTQPSSAFAHPCYLAQPTSPSLPLTLPSSLVEVNGQRCLF